MAQLIMKDSGLLIEEGRTQQQYESDPGWDPNYFSVVDTGQTFDQLDLDPVASGRVPDRQVWFYVQSLDQFFQSTGPKHAYLSALETQFSPGRWTALINGIDWPINELLHELKMDDVNARLTLEQSGGLMDAGELAGMTAVCSLPS